MFFSAQEKSLPSILDGPGCPSPGGDNREGSAPLGHIPFSGFLASPEHRAASSFPPQAGSQGPAGTPGPGNQKRVCICPTWDETETATWHRMPGPSLRERASPAPPPHNPSLAAQRCLHTASLQGPSGTSCGTTGFQSLTEYSRTQLSNNESSFFSEASFNTHEKSPPSKQFSRVTSENATHSLSSGHPFCSFFIFHQFPSQTFPSFLLCIPSFASFLPPARPLSTRIPLDPLNSQLPAVYSRPGLGRAGSHLPDRLLSHTQVARRPPHFPGQGQASNEAALLRGCMRNTKGPQGTEWGL